MPDGPRFRVGRSLGRTIYDHDTLIGIMDTPELGAKATAALNALGPYVPLWRGEAHRPPARWDWRKGDSYIRLRGVPPGTWVTVTETPVEADR